MFTKTLLSTTAFVAAASAYLPNLQARQTGPVLSEQCQSAVMDLMPIMGAMPTAPPVVTAAALADPCATPDLSGSELSQWESYMSVVSDWANSNSAALNSAAQECDEFTDLAPVPVCTGSAAQPTGSSSDDSTSSSSDDTSSSTSTDEPSNTEDGNATETPGAASRETGMMAAAVVVAAGVLGFLL
ncbi:hypothetical protein DL770_001914 [Monosporascus sp. CRB-9-2]|nr:hypothetical protein DL770_001914 [Monosporascus sp. CRB-9-2]